MKVYRFIRHLSTPRNISFFGTATAGFFALFNLTRVPEKLAKLAGYNGKLKLFTLDSIGYTNPDNLHRLLNVYGEAGRKAYVYESLTLDTAFPVCYSLFMTTATEAVLQKLYPDSNKYRLFTLLPLLTALIDYMENTSHYALIASYPRQPKKLAYLKMTFTTVKTLLFVISLLQLVGLYLYMRKSAGQNIKAR